MHKNSIIKRECFFITKTTAESITNEGIANSIRFDHEKQRQKRKQLTMEELEADAEIF